MKRIIVTMMAMVMMTMFGSVTANAAKRDELEVYSLMTLKQFYKELYANENEVCSSVDMVILELDEGDKYPVIDTRSLTMAYTRYKGLKNVMFTGKLILVEDAETSEDIEFRFIYTVIENGKLVTKGATISTEELRWEKYLTEICAYL